MSYARLGVDGSDVYIFNTGEHLVCGFCRLLGPEAPDMDHVAMYKHLGEHLVAGHRVPWYVFARMDEESAPDSQSHKGDKGS